MSKQSLVIFGSGDIAQLAHYYFSRDSDYEVVAFTVDAAYVQGIHSAIFQSSPSNGWQSTILPRTTWSLWR